MHLLVEAPVESLELLEQSQTILKSILMLVSPTVQAKELKPAEDLFKNGCSREALYLIKDGKVKFSVNGQLFMLFEEGDVLGLDLYSSLKSGVFASEFVIKTEEFSKPRFFQMVRGNTRALEAWQEFLQTQAKLYMLMSGSFFKMGLKSESSVELFAAGATIIEQGSVGTEVFTLIEGTADVKVNGVKVGEVKAGEIFGAMAAFTKTPRTAEVVASADCTVISVPEDQFMDLMKNRPDTVLQMCKKMAETIADLNQKVVTLSKK